MPVNRRILTNFANSEIFRVTTLPCRQFAGAFEAIDSSDELHQ